MAPNVFREWSGEEATNTSSSVKPKVDPLRRKNTFSAVGLGHERIPFLSIQQSACNKIQKKGIDFIKPKKKMNYRNG